MSDPFLGEIRIFGFNFAPYGWAQCNGQILSIQQSTALFSLLGANYGGDGISTFGLPNLQGAAAMFWQQGPGTSSYTVGESGGTPAETLLVTELPQHTHVVQAFQGRGRPSHGTPLSGDALTSSGSVAAYGPAPPNGIMSGAALSPAGGGAAHNNMMPSLVLNYCIALNGIYPPRG